MEAAKESIYTVIIFKLLNSFKIIFVLIELNYKEVKDFKNL